MKESESGITRHVLRARFKFLKKLLHRLALTQNVDNQYTYIILIPLCKLTIKQTFNVVFATLFLVFYHIRHETICSTIFQVLWLWADFIFDLFLYRTDLEPWIR